MIWRWKIRKPGRRADAVFSHTLSALCLLTVSFVAQTPSSPTTQIETDLSQALAGQWTGVLEYRDYSEPSASMKRVQLPTWLTISSVGRVLTEHFVYDDGPGKTVDSTQTITFDAGGQTYTEQESSKPAQVSKVAGFDTLKSGRGELLLLGHGLDNNKPAETRMTLTIRRNLLTWLEEVRPANTQEPFRFRHRYTFTRAVSPTVAK